MILTLLRHGQSANNKAWRRAKGDVAAYDRVPEPGLTALGRAQAAHTAAWIEQLPPEQQPTHLYTSLMARAVLTAQPIAEALGLPLHGRLDCFEVGGPYTVGPDGVRVAAPGLTRAELASRFLWLKTPEWEGDGSWWPGPYETPEATDARAAAFLTDLLATHGPQDRVLVVTHQAFARAVITHALGLGPGTGRFRLWNCAHTRLHWDDQGAACVWTNRFDHLAVEERSG